VIHKWMSMEYWWNYNDLEKIGVLRQTFVALSLCKEHPTGASMGLNPGFHKVYFKITTFIALSLSLSIYIYVYKYVYLYMYIYIYICVCVCVCMCMCDCKFVQVSHFDSFTHFAVLL